MNTYLASFLNRILLTFCSILLLAGMLKAQSQTLHTGIWKADSYFTTFEGSWSIIQNDAKLMLLLNEDFESKKAPDLKIFLSKLDLDDIDGDNASDTQVSIFVSDLKKYKGATSYEIPQGIDLSEYKTILVHCKKYAKFWGGSPLR